MVVSRSAIEHSFDNVLKVYWGLCEPHRHSEPSAIFLVTKVELYDNSVSNGILLNLS